MDDRDDYDDDPTRPCSADLLIMAIAGLLLVAYGGITVFFMHREIHGREGSMKACR
jgi:hypothetical protein